MARELEITVTADASQAKRELAQVDTAVQKVNASSTGLDQTTQKLQTNLNKLDAAPITSVATEMVTLEATAVETTGVFATLRAGVAGFAEELGITFAALGAVGSALAVVGVAFASWKLGEWIYDFFQLDDVIQSNITTAQSYGAAQDTINFAIARGAKETVGFAEAMQYNDEWVQRHTASIKGNTAEVEAAIKRQEEFTVIIDRGAHDIVPYATAEMLKLDDATKQYSVTLNGPATDAVKKFEDAIKKQATDTIPSWKKAMDEWDKVTGASSRGLEGLAAQGGAVSRGLGVYIDYTKQAKDADKAHEQAIKDKRTALKAEFDAMQNVIDAEIDAIYASDRAMLAARNHTIALDTLGVSLKTVKDLQKDVNAYMAGITVQGFGVTQTPDSMLSGFLSSTQTPLPTLGKSIGDQITAGITSSFASLPSILQRAFEGSGGIAGAFKSLGVQLADSIITPLINKLNKLGQGAVGVGASIAGGVGGQIDTAGAIIGATAGSIGGAAVGAAVTAAGVGAVAGAVAIGAATAGIGLAAVAAYYGLKKLFSASEESKALQKAQDTIVEQLKNIATKSQIAEGALVDNYHTIAIVARDAFSEAGYSVDVTDAKIKALLNTKRPQDFANAMAELGQVLDDNAKKQELITQYTNDTGEALDTVNEAMKKWNLTINDMGPAFKQQNLDAMAGDLLKDFTLLTAAGGDSVTVLEHMKGGFQELVNASITTGTAIPENLKGVIQKLIDMGDLTDEAGNKLTDVGQLQWTTPIDKKFEELLKHIDDLVNALNYDLTGAINGLPDHTVHIDLEEQLKTYPFDPNYKWVEPGRLGDSNLSTGGIAGVNTQYFGSGGNVYPFRARGSDTVPAMLTPGEMVLTSSQQKAIGALMQRGGSSGGSGDTVIHTHVTLDGREIASSVERIQDQKLRTRRKLRAA